MGEVFIAINGERKYRWRAVDQGGTVLDILVQNRQDKTPAHDYRAEMTVRFAVWEQLTGCG